MISAGSREARKLRLYIGIERSGGTGGMLNVSLQLHVPRCGPLPAWWNRYSHRNTNSLKSLHQEVRISLTGSKSTELYTEHGSSVMVLLIQGTEGLFYSLRKDNDNLCNTLCCNMHVWLDSFFFSFSLVFRMKKSHTCWQEKLAN